MDLPLREAKELFAAVKAKELIEASEILPEIMNSVLARECRGLESAPVAGGATQAVPTVESATHAAVEESANQAAPTVGTTRSIDETAVHLERDEL